MTEIHQKHGNIISWNDRTKHEETREGIIQPSCVHLYKNSSDNSVNRVQRLAILA
jgi:hypothetical protein